MDYYDLVLGLIPGSFIAGLAGLSVLGIDTTTAIPIAATAALGIIGHALFVRSPDGLGDTPDEERPQPNTGQQRLSPSE